MRRHVCCVLAILFSVSSTICAQQQTTIPGEAAAARIAWWRDAKFGLFVHWGVYSIPGRGEWVQWDEQIPVDEYAKLSQQFIPDKFDPNAWAAVANAAGMKYTVLTSRHHDGFALFDDPGSSFTSIKSAAHRDFVAEYVSAVRKAGLRVGLYYSPLDWRYPGFFFPDVYRSSAIEMREQYERQINELASHYGKLDLIWFDGGGVDWLGFNGVNFKNGWKARPKGEHYIGSFSWHDDQVIDNLRRLQPSIIINDRTDAPADFQSREGDQAMGDFQSKYPWELCSTITIGAWGYQPGAKVKSRDDILLLLVGAVGRDGNLLLNVGPRPDGQIDPAQAERLREVGDWLRKYGQSIYGTRGGPYLPGDFGVSTYHDRTIFLHLLRAKNEVVRLPPLPAQLLSCSNLTGGTVACTQTVAGIDITLSSIPETVDTIVALSLDSAAIQIAPIATPVSAHTK